MIGKQRCRVKPRRLCIEVILLTLLLTFPSLFSIVLAQGTTLTYEGHLYDGNYSANGFYNFQFTIHDSFTNGTVVAGPLTNSFVGVTNGMFVVSLDFGSGIFSGEARYLEISVQTNGATTFTSLVPRQMVTPMPYAIMANAASNLLGTIPAGQLTGSILLSQMPAMVLTNGSTGVTLNGSFVGNGAGLTNLDGVTPPQSVSTNSLDNSLWLRIQAASFQDYNCYNRFRWSNVMRKIATGQNIRLLITGTGLVGFELLKGAWTNWLSANLTNAGYFTWYDSMNYTDQGTNTTPMVFRENAQDTNWPGNYFVGTNGTGFRGNTANGSTAYAWNTISVHYLAWQNGSTTIKLQTNNGTGGFTDAATFSGKNASASYIGTNFFWTNSIVTSRWPAYNLVIASNGTNCIVDVGVWNSAVPSNSFTVGYDFIEASGSTASEVKPGGAILQPIYAAWNPDMIVWNDIEGTNAAHSETNIANLIELYTNACRNAAIVMTITYPCIGEDVYGALVNEWMIHSNVVKYAQAGANIACFDGHGLFESTNNFFDRGYYYYNVAGGYTDGTHPSTAGAAAYGYLLNAWLGFSDAALFNSGDAEK